MKKSVNTHLLAQWPRLPGSAILTLLLTAGLAGGLAADELLVENGYLVDPLAETVAALSAI